MRVLVTRPQPGAARTAARLSELGHDVVVMPLFEASVTAAMGDLPPVTEIGGLIATSARAFDMFEGIPLSETGLSTMPVHAVGSATAQAARLVGFEHVHEGGGTAQALLQALIVDLPVVASGADVAFSRVLRKPLVYLAGVPRTPVLEAGLRAHQIGHTVVECYQMHEISYSTDILKTDILSPAPDVILFYSANAARSFTELEKAVALDEAIESKHFICLSETVAAELPRAWQPRVRVAERPDEDSLLESLSALE